MNHHFKRISPELKVASKPPVASSTALFRKRHSIHTVDSLQNLNKLARHSSQHELQRKEESSSWGNLRLLDSKNRSASLAQLKTSERTLSASNLAALSDSNLSLQVALPLRSYENLGSQSNIAKKDFEISVKRYFDQLTVGCGNEKCWNKFCASCPSSKKINHHIASFLSIELATLGKQYFCKESSPKNFRALDFGNLYGKPRPFLHKFFDSSPFKFLFSNVDATLKPNRHIYNSGSEVALSGSHTCNTAKLSLSSSNICNSTRVENGLTYNSKDLDVHVSKPLSITTKDNLESGNKDTILDKVVVTSSSPEVEISIESLGADSSNLEEFEMECALEMSSSSVKELSLTHLTLPMLETSIENYKKCGDPSFLINTIRTVFTSPEALNASFLKDSLSYSDPQWKRLDLTAVRKSYELLLDLEPKPVFLHPLQNSVEIHLKTLQSCDVKHSQIFQLVILLENPLLLDACDLLQTFCHILARINPKTKNALLEILVNYNSFHFQRIVKAFKKLLGSQVHTYQSSESHIVVICMTLRLLYDVNVESQKRGRQLVPISDFYIGELSKKLNYKKEYEKWIAQTEQLAISIEQLSNVSILEFPFVLEPASKVRIMHIHAAWQMGIEYRDAIVYQARVQQAKNVYEGSEDFQVEESVKSAMNPFLVLEVRRDHLIKDTLVQMHLKENDLKKALKIRYVGGGEQGLDLGGLQKEFFHIITNDIIQPDYGMFTYLDEVERMWINSASLEFDVMFELVGTLLGIAIYNGIILDLHFPPIIYKKLQGGETSLVDLTHVDPSLARSLQSLLDFEGDVENTFCYTFQISHRIFDEVVDVDLKRNGGALAVTKENREEFVKLYVDYLLNKSIERQFNAFSRGFHKVCDDTCLKLFQVEELELLICGSPDIDFSAIEESTSYDNGFSRKHPTIVAFWEIVHDMATDEKKSLLSFVTGSDRVPLKGLSSVAFQIIKQGEDSNKLPTASTCFNQLMLPEYSSKEKLQDRLLLAIKNSKGFGLT